MPEHGRGCAQRQSARCSAKRPLLQKAKALNRLGDQGLPGDWVVIRVLDSGPGVPDEDKARLFDRFETGQTRPDRAPSGLGLSIVARVAQVHGGRVAVSVNSPEGSVFELVLPLQTNAP